MKPKLSELASVAEVIGAVAIVVSLIYVGIQVNDSNRAVRSASVNDANVAVQQWYLQIGSNVQASHQFYNSLMSDVIQSKEAEFQYMMIMHGIFLGFQSSYLMAEEGTVDPEVVDGLAAAILAIKDTPGLERYWRQRRTLLHPRFGEYVDDLLTREGETPMEIYRIPESNQIRN